MAYTTLTIETAVDSVTLSSHSIPAYPEYSSSTTFNAAFYAARQAQEQKLVSDDDTYTIAVPT